MVPAHDAQLIERVTEQNMFGDFAQETSLAPARHTRLAAFTLHASADFRATTYFGASRAFTFHFSSWHLGTNRNYD